MEREKIQIGNTILKETIELRRLAKADFKIHNHFNNQREWWRHKIRRTVST